MNEGPSKVIVPKRELISCSGCDYHSQKLVRSGRHPIYQHYCKNPKVADMLKAVFLELDVESEAYPIPDPKCPFK